MRSTFSTLVRFLQLGILFFLHLAAANAEDVAKPKVGVLFSSFGDVDEKSEIRPLVIKVLMDPDVAPLPNFGRGLIVRAGWELDKSAVYRSYAAIGWKTGMREISQKQADLIAQKLQQRGINARGYVGFSMTTPWLSDTLDRMRQDGVETVIAFNQGAQYSRSTTFVMMRIIKDYLKKYPSWGAHVVASRSISDDKRFQELVINNIEQRLQTSFADMPREDVCIVLPMHGNPIKLVRAGDPSYGQMLRVVDAVRDHFPTAKVFFGFQNHNEIPIRWTQPSIENVLGEVADDRCKGVLINGRISFTVDSLETLYEQAVEHVQIIEERSQGKRIFVEKMFNDDEDFVELMSDVTQEALQGQGDLFTLR